MGDTRGGNWGCHPSIVSWKTWRPFLVASSAVSPLFILFSKTDDLFFAHRCRYHYHFLLLSLECHSSRGCHPAVFLLVRPCFSTILCKFVHKKIPSGITPGVNLLYPRPLVTPLYSNLFIQFVLQIVDSKWPLFVIWSTVPHVLSYCMRGSNCRCTCECCLMLC